LASTSSRKRNITSARRDSEAARQAGWAAKALATAAMVSAAVDATTSACCSPVAGSQTGSRRLPEPATAWPSIQFIIVFIVLVPPGYTR
jgi:hypothetical protein